LGTGGAEGGDPPGGYLSPRSSIPEEIAVSGREESGESPLQRVWREWAEGLHVIAHRRLLGGLLIVGCLAMCAQGIVNALLVPFVREVLHGGSEQFGLLATVQGIGGLVGGLLVGRMQRVISPARLVATGAMLTGVVMFAILLSRRLAVVMALVGIAGLPVVAWMVSTQALLQGVDDRYRGRVLGAFGTTESLAMLVGLGVAGVLAGPLGVVGALEFAAGAYVVAAGV